MATEKEKAVGIEKQDEDANPIEMEVDDAEKVGEEGGDENTEENEVGEEEVKEDREDEDEEGHMDEEEEAEVEVEGNGEDEDEEEQKIEEEVSEKKSETLKKRSRKSEIGELEPPRTPVSERPTRERKTVDRFMVGQSPKASASKTLLIVQGQGTQLKDIPNVAFKLSKRKTDENLQLLHTILFGKRSKAHSMKRNIGQFSGFVWVENEEKQRAKLKDKLEKCVKEKLLDFCDFLNIPVHKTTAKKEELSTKLLEFLESPHATTDSLLADKGKGKKRKSKASTSKSSSNATAGKSKKKQKLDAESESGKKPKHSTEEEEEDNISESSQSEENHDDDNTVHEGEGDQEEPHSEGGTDKDEDEDEDEDEPEKHMVVEKSSKKNEKKDTGKTELKSKSVGKESHVKASNSGKSTKEALPKRKAKASLSKNKKDDEESEEEKEVPTKVTSSSKKMLNKSSEKNQGKGKSAKAAEKQPSREEMHAVVSDMLKEVDFNTATLSDILKKLGKHFGVDLMDRKSEVKDLITEVIENMSDDEDAEEAKSGDESGKDEDEDDE